MLWLADVYNQLSQQRGIPLKLVAFAAGTSRNRKLRLLGYSRRNGP